MECNVSQRKNDKRSRIPVQSGRKRSNEIASWLVKTGGEVKGKVPWRTINFEALLRGNEPGRTGDGGGEVRVLARICMQEQLATPPRGSPLR